MTTAARLGPVDQLPPGTGRQVAVDGHQLAVFNVDGCFRAVAGRCLHQGAPLGEGAVVDDAVECPWHGWRYDLRTGARVDRRGSPLTVHELAVHNGWLYCLDPPP